MIDPWIALGTNMVLLGVLGVLIEYANSTRMVVVWQDYVGSAFILAMAGGMAAMLAWGLTRAWA